MLHSKFMEVNVAIIALAAVVATALYALELIARYGNDIQQAFNN